jgi:LEA14-like dessication related protein
MNMRRLMLCAVSAAMVVTAGCSALGRQAFKEPIVRLEDVRVNGVGLTGGNLNVRLSVFNPNGYRLDATRMSYNVTVGDSVRFATGTVDSRFTVNGKDSSVVTIPVNFTYTGIGAAGRQLLNTGGVDYRVNGDVTVGTVVGNFSVPYKASGRFNALGGTTRQ